MVQIAATHGAKIDPKTTMGRHALFQQNGIDLQRKYAEADLGYYGSHDTATAMNAVDEQEAKRRWLHQRMAAGTLIDGFIKDLNEQIGGIDERLHGKDGTGGLYAKRDNLDQRIQGLQTEIDQLRDQRKSAAGLIEERAKRKALRAEMQRIESEKMGAHIRGDERHARDCGDRLERIRRKLGISDAEYERHRRALLDKGIDIERVDQKLVNRLDRKITGLERDIKKLKIERGGVDTEIKELEKQRKMLVETRDRLKTDKDLRAKIESGEINTRGKLLAEFPPEMQEFAMEKMSVRATINAAKAKIVDGADYVGNQAVYALANIEAAASSAWKAGSNAVSSTWNSIGEGLSGYVSPLRTAFYGPANGEVTPTQTVVASANNDATVKVSSDMTLSA